MLSQRHRQVDKAIVPDAVFADCFARCAEALGALEREAAQAEDNLKKIELASYFLPFFLAPLLQLNLGRLRSGSLFALVSQR